MLSTINSLKLLQIQKINSILLMFDVYFNCERINTTWGEYLKT